MICDKLYNHFDIIDRMIANNKTTEDIKKYIDSFKKKTLFDLYQEELNILSKNMNKPFTNSFGNIEGNILIVIDKLSKKMYNGEKDPLASDTMKSLLNNAADKINPKFDTTNIYKTFFYKYIPTSDKDIGLFVELLEKEIQILNPKFIICMGEESSKIVIKKDYNIETDGLFSEDPIMIGCKNIFEISEITDPLMVKNLKENIWKKFCSLSEKIK